MAFECVDELLAQVRKAGLDMLLWGLLLETSLAMTGASVICLQVLREARRSAALSFEVGDLRPQAVLDFIRKYRQLETCKSLLVRHLVGHRVSCNHYQAEAVIVTGPHRRALCLPHDLHHCIVIKVLDDEQFLVLCGVKLGVKICPLDEAGVALVRHQGPDLPREWDNHLRMNKLPPAAQVYMEALRRLPQSGLRVDETGRVALHTARSQLRRAMAKVGVTKQAELVRCIGRLPQFGSHEGAL